MSWEVDKKHYFTVYGQELMKAAKEHITLHMVLGSTELRISPPEVS